MEGGKISIGFPQYHFTAEIIDEKLVIVSEVIFYSNQRWLSNCGPLRQTLWIHL